MRASTCALALMLLVGCDTAEVKEKPDPKKETLEYKLAFIDGQGRAEDLQVNRFRYLLDELSKTTGLSRDEVADWSAKGHSYAKEHYGKRVSIIELMEDAKQFYEQTGAKWEYGTLITLLVTEKAR
jgi:hypothetical protein